MELLLTAHLSYNATFSLSQRWPLNTGLNVSIIMIKHPIITPSFIISSDFWQQLRYWWYKLRMNSLVIQSSWVHCIFLLGFMLGQSLVPCVILCRILFVLSPIDWVCDRCVTSKWAIVQLYHGKNKLHSMKWWWRSLCIIPKTFNWIFIVLAHWNNSPWVDMSLH